MESGYPTSLIMGTVIISLVLSEDEKAEMGPLACGLQSQP